MNLEVLATAESLANIKQKEEIVKKQETKIEEEYKEQENLTVFSLVGFLFYPHVWIIAILLILIIIFITIKLTKKGKHERLKILKLTLQNANKEFKNENLSMTVSLLADALKLLIAFTFKIEKSVESSTLLELADKYKSKKDLYKLAIKINKIRFSHQKDKTATFEILEELNNMIAKIKK